ncbi:unnamed protein product, partial [Vitis vinifera]|uniref:Uncharacterized protein n=1 Tax=Vitis vinifera TaxID=29760 RepID=D7U8G1_VITVI
MKKALDDTVITSISVSSLITINLSFILNFRKGKDTTFVPKHEEELATVRI